MSIASRVLEQYPSLAWLLNDREIGPLLRDAVDPNKGFSPQTFQAKLYETNWWKTHSAAGRQLEIEKRTDPASYRDRFRNFQASMNQIANQLGVYLTNAQQTWLTTWGLGQGIEPNNQRILNELVRITNPASIAKGQGQIGVLAHQASFIASSKYFAPMTLKRSIELGRNLAMGKDTLESIEERLRVQAMSRHPHLKDRLAAGESLADIVDPMRALVAEELELSGPGAVDVIKDPKWRQLLGIRDPKTNKTRLPTESDVINLARTQEAWWKTSKGRQMDAEGATKVLNMMGAIR